MSEKDVENVRRGFEAYNRDGVRAVAERYWHPAIEWEVGPWGPALGLPPRVRGREPAITAFEETESVLGGLSVEVLDVTRESAGIVAELRVHGTGAASGVPAEQLFWWVFQLEDGWQRRIRIFDNRAEAVAAASLQE
jgi:ketosteroid isomerase-like protein